MSRSRPKYSFKDYMLMPIGIILLSIAWIKYKLNERKRKNKI